MGQLRLYCDESGHTGSDPFHRQQPVFVIAFVELDEDQESRLLAPLKAVRAKTDRFSPREIKFAKLKGAAEGEACIREIGEALLAVGARTYFALVEKRFFAPTLVLETLADESLNPAAPPGSDDGGWRRWLDNKLYETLPDDVLRQFYEAAQTQDLAGVRAAGERLVGLLRLHPDDRVVEAAKVLAVGLMRPWTFDDEPGAPPFPDPIMMAFGNLLVAADLVLRPEGKRADILADVDKKFGPTLDMALTLSRDPDVFPNGKSAYGMPGPIVSIDRRLEVASESSDGIQLADVVAGVVRWIAVETNSNGRLTREKARVWEPFRQLAGRGHSWWQASEHFLRSLVPSFGGLLPPFDRT